MTAPPAASNSRMNSSCAAAPRRQSCSHSLGSLPAPGIATKVSTSDDAANGPGCSGFTRRAGDAASASAATTLRSTSGDFANIRDSWAPRPVWELQGQRFLCSGFEALLSAIFVAQRLHYRSMAVFGSSKVPSDVRDALEIRKSH